MLYSTQSHRRDSRQIRVCHAFPPADPNAPNFLRSGPAAGRALLDTAEFVAGVMRFDPITQMQTAMALEQAAGVADARYFDPLRAGDGETFLMNLSGDVGDFVGAAAFDVMLGAATAGAGRVMALRGVSFADDAARAGGGMRARAFSAQSKAPKASASPIGGLTQTDNKAFERYRAMKARKRWKRRLQTKRASDPNTTGDLFEDE